MGDNAGVGVVRPTVQLKCIYTNTHSVGNKKEQLEATVWKTSYDLIAITETWCDDSQNWSAAMEQLSIVLQVKLMRTKNPKHINDLLQTSHVELHATGKAWPSDEVQTANYSLVLSEDK